MSKLVSAPNKNPIRVTPVKITLPDPYVEASLHGGLNTELDPADLNNNELQLAKNTVIRLDQVGRRFGSSTLNTKPNSNQLVSLTTVKRFDKTTYLLRFTSTTIHKLNSGTWTILTGYTLTGGNTNRFKVASINDRFFFANGVDNVQEMNLSTNAVTPLGNAGKWKYIIGFHNRVVVANFTGASLNPIALAWSGILNFAEFDPLNDISAGSEPLVENPEGYTDEITGLFSFGSQLLILRQSSLWLANKQQTSANPFYVYQADPQIGCDCPDTAVQIPNGVCFFNYKLGNVYSFQSSGLEGSNPQSPKALAFKIRRQLLSAFESSDQVQGSYNPYNQEYSLAFYSLTTSYAKVFVYNFINESWSYREYNLLTCLSDIINAFNVGTYDSDIGTFDAAMGTYDQGSPNVDAYTRVFGLSSGDILYEDQTKDTDNGTVYITDIGSKLFDIPLKVQQVLELHLEFISNLSGSFTIQFSRDNVNFTNYKTVNFTKSPLRQLVISKKNIRTRSYVWKITSQSGQFDITNYAFYTKPVDEERSNS